MIEPGYNGIEFGKYSEEQFLQSISSSDAEFCKLITHRDTQDRGDHWRVQGTINSTDFCVYLLNNPMGLDDVSIKREHKDSLNFIVTINILKTTL